MVVAYAAHPLTWALGRQLVRGVAHLALPNILLGRTAVPEHLQRLDPAAMAADLVHVARDPRVEADLVRVRERLGEPGASRRAAAALLDGLSEGKQGGSEGFVQHRSARTGRHAVRRA
jgi:lipid-A-disaccharide synthase